MQEKLDSISFNHLFCENKNPVKLFCCSQNCQEIACVCRNQECQCLPKNHQDCEFIYAKSLIDQINKRKLSLTPQIEAATKTIQNIYQDAIDKLSQDREALLKWKQSFGLSFCQIEFLEMINRNEKEKLTGAYINNLRKNFKQNLDFSWLTQNWVHDFWKKGKKYFHQLFKQLNQLIPHKNQEILEYNNSIESKIIQNSIKLKEMFDSNRKIKRFNLLYRASENDFSVDVFHGQCDRIPNTVTIARTQHNKILGGYTPIPWQTNQNGSTVQDPTGLSFLFSISLGCKFPLLNKKQAIVHQDKYGPTFGSMTKRGSFSGSTYLDGDFRIFAKYGCLNFPINYGYSNEGQRIQSSQVSINQILGGTTITTNLKQWEVFQVIFEQD